MPPTIIMPDDYSASNFCTLLEHLLALAAEDGASRLVPPATQFLASSTQALVSHCIKNGNHPRTPHVFERIWLEISIQAPTWLTRGLVSSTMQFDTIR